ncbi:hypothetical protein [Salinibacterium sp. PAMC 21357]|uniref:hypothetical protein n=1 Tax=Salinibacterium sp. PAMC 21357 TaxID=1112215 RepID=UPI0002E702CC|nr:hypothetical protein [Salinibacterium sp. PAMC 21357]
MRQQSALLDEETVAAAAADRLDRRNAVIVSTLGFIGVIISGALLIFGDAVL